MVDALTARIETRAVVVSVVATTTVTPTVVYEQQKKMPCHNYTETATNNSGSNGSSNRITAPSSNNNNGSIRTGTINEIISSNNSVKHSNNKSILRTSAQSPNLLFAQPDKSSTLPLRSPLRPGRGQGPTARCHSSTYQQK